MDARQRPLEIRLSSAPPKRGCVSWWRGVLLSRGMISARFTDALLATGVTQLRRHRGASSGSRLALVWRQVRRQYSSATAPARLWSRETLPRRRPNDGFGRLSVFRARTAPKFLQAPGKYTSRHRRLPTLWQSRAKTDQVHRQTRFCKLPLTVSNNSPRIYRCSANCIRPW